MTARADATSTVSGAVKPLAAGTTVELQLDDGSGWSTAAQTTTGPTGEYTIAPPEPGVYRVRVAPAQGFAEGLSGQIELR